MNQRQLSLPIKRHRFGTKAFLVEEREIFGGALNYRKKKRPFQRSRAVHLIFRSSRLEGARSLLKQNRNTQIEKYLKDRAKRYGARLYRYSVNSNHIHLLVRFSNAKLQAAFMRDFAGTLALWLKRTLHIKGPLWDARPFSRLIKRTAYRAIERYIERNRNEAAGSWAYQPRPVSDLLRILERIASGRLPPRLDHAA